MEGLREGRKEREREQRVPKESRRQRGEKERWRAREEETFPVELMLWGHFFIFFIEMGYSLRWIFLLYHTYLSS